MHPFMTDAQAAMSFAIQQATRINATVYQRKYGDIRYRGLIFVDTSGPEWLNSVTYMSVDGVGKAEWFDANADDVPHAELLRSKTETTVALAAMGYGWNTGELAHAQMLGIPLANTKAMYARRASEEMIDRVVFQGDATRGFTGLMNNPLVTVADAAATGTASSTLWSAKTVDQINRDINGVLTGIYTGTAYTGSADTLLLPFDRLNYLADTRLSDSSETTLLAWIQANNVYTRETGRQLTIRSVRGLETAGQGGTARMVAYRNSEEVVKLHMPMPFRFLPVWQAGPMRFEVPGIFRLGGVEFMLPKEATYLDGI